MNYFIWTECIGCPEIGNIAIKSFLKHHSDYKLNVFTLKDDLNYLPKDERLTYHIFSKTSHFSFLKNRIVNKFKKKYKLTENLLKNYFKKGHKGTAYLWGYIFKNFKNIDCFIHFDSDVVFCEDGISDLIYYSKEHELVGQCRPYKFNKINPKFNKLPDLVATCFFLFKPSLCSSIIRLNQSQLAEAILGRRRITGEKLIDFFDQISLEIINNKGRVKFLSVEDYGGPSKYGSRESKFSKLNNTKTKFKMDVGKKLVHFSAVGSGYNVWKNKASSGSKNYDEYALDRLSLFMECFYPNIKIRSYKLDQYKELIDYFKKNNFI